MTAIIKIDTRSKAAKIFLAYAKTLASVEVEDEISSHQELVEKIKRAQTETGEKMTTAQELRGNL
jgi:hypothetical protein